MHIAQISNNPGSYFLKVKKSIHFSLNFGTPYQPGNEDYNDDTMVMMSTIKRLIIIKIMKIM